jgi:DNA invertase Pin-like site-specific DNA recombinase
MDRPQLVRAAEYVRMSTEGQQYSIANQQAAIRQYASERGFAIVRTYADEGKSGLKLKGRRGLIELLTDVQEEHTEYAAILVYDVSRWGRFQDTDESGFYEYLCRRANIDVRYCVEPFENDGGPIAALVKNIKRIMAAEYSREQSARVHRAACHVASLGFHAGGQPPYGLRRMLVAADGTPRGLLAPGVRKAISTDRVVLALGPPDELRTVRRIFRLYVSKKLPPRAIAEILNRGRASVARDRPWCESTIAAMLRNEAYIGTNTYNRVSRRLRGGFWRNDPAKWIRTAAAFEAIIPPKIFEAAQARRRERGYREHTDASLLDRLRLLLREKGSLSARVIKGDRLGPHLSIYRRRFGGLRKAFAMIGYVQTRDRHDVAMAKIVSALTSSLAHDIMRAVEQRGASTFRAPHHGGMITINGQFTLAVGAARYLPTPALQLPCWQLNSKRKIMPQFFAVARMDPRNQAAMDYLLVPQSSIRSPKTYFGDSNIEALAEWRYATMDKLINAVVTQVRSGRPAIPAAAHWSHCQEPAR